MNVRQALIAGCLALGSTAAASAAGEPPLGEVFERFRAEAAIERLLIDDARVQRPKTVVFTHVRLIPMAGDERSLPDQTVLVRDGRISEVGATGQIAVPSGAAVVDGRGRSLLPGLVDMHVHTLVSSGDYLLDLAQGVTSVREMDGFPWMLRLRAGVARDGVLAPNLYVAGHILSSQPMDGYATMVRTPAEAVAALRAQKAAGYEFVKVHNLLPLEVYDAAVGEARRLRLDVVGHVPHQVTLAHALESGQRTIEHFKGYILDAGLTLTGEPYVQLTRGRDVWLCPTFYTWRESSRGADATRFVEKAPEMRYVWWRVRKAWLAVAGEPVDAKVKARQGVLPLSQKIFHDLLPLGNRFLTGTDAGGGMPLMVRGFGLHEEMALFARAGMAPFEILKAATINAARALRHDSEIGTVERGKRADLLLVSGDPLGRLEDLSRIDGVMVRGLWLERAELDRLLSGLAAIDEEPKGAAQLAAPGPEQWEGLVRDLERLSADGFPAPDLYLVDPLAALLAEHGQPALAARVKALRID